MCGDDRKEFGLESFISPTLLSNMREKDLRKAISYHLKKIQSLLEPRQKVDTHCLVMVCSDFILLVQLEVINCYFNFLLPSSTSYVVGNFCNTSSVGLPHATGRAYLIRGTIIHGYNDGKGASRRTLAEAALYRQFIRQRRPFPFPFFAFLHSFLHSASGQGGVSQPAGGSQVRDESSHQPQTQRDLYAGGVQQHQPSGVAVRVR